MPELSNLPNYLTARLIVTVLRRLGLEATPAGALAAAQERAAVAENTVAQLLEAITGPERTFASGSEVTRTWALIRELGHLAGTVLPEAVHELGLYVRENAELRLRLAQAEGEAGMLAAVVMAEATDLSDS